MSLLGNIVWLIFGGLISAICWFIGGALLCITILGIPFGVQCFKIGWATLAPFGKRIVELPDAHSAGRILANILWLVVLGWELAVAHLVWACVLAITVIGLPFAAQHIKMIPLALMPFGRDLR